MNIDIPEFSLVVLIGASGSGKSTFARTHFKPTEVISSDVCRGLVSDDENAQHATPDAFDVLHYIAAKRLANMRLTVIDATNVQKAARQSLLQLAREYHALPVAIVLDLPPQICIERNASRPERGNMRPRVVKRQRADLKRSLKSLKREGFKRVHILREPEEVDAVTITRDKLWADKREETGPFDIIGDIHACFDELSELLQTLGYQIEEDPTALEGLGGYRVTPPEGRKAIFVGDYVDRGPKPVETLRLVMSMLESDVALCLPGNHDVKLHKALRGKKVQLSHGLADTMAALEAESQEFRDAVREFVYSLISHYVLSGGELVVAHAGMKEEYAGRASGRVREFALYGETTGETDEFGLPVRLNWAADYRGQAAVVYGHTPIAYPEWFNNTINIDTGCCFGGSLTALRYPERELVLVTAKETYVEPVRPFQPEETTFSAQQLHDDMLDIADVTGKRIVETGLIRQVIVREENSIAALEIMSRFAVNPKWLIYLPPTMSPSETSRRPDLLEHPDEAFEYFRREGIERVICEEKHMGSRAVVIVCRDEEAAMQRFGVTDEGIGIVYTRTGRRFFDAPQLEAAFLERIRNAVSASGLWEDLDTDWLCFDAELMPWSAKAQGLLESQYAAVGAASQTALQEAVGLLQKTSANGIDTSALMDRLTTRAEMVNGYIDAYRQYCWPVTTLDDLTLAPFHLLASEGAVHTDKDHVWHMDTLAHVCRFDQKLLLATPYRLIAVNDPDSVADGISWWEEMTGCGGEGMVVKPYDFIVRGPRGLVQPAVKCRGREYLRIIYGPEYTLPKNIDQLRKRGLGRKRSMALREFALGIEALERFVRREPLRRVHECVFGVLAMESEPVDPRL